MAYDDEDDERPPYSRRQSAAKMSKTPSWIMLGFVLGALFVWALPPREKKAPPRQTVELVAPTPPPGPRTKPLLTTIEAVFEQWKEHAVWSDATTEVALWNEKDRAFSDFYEVRRYGTDTYYYRSIPRLTRRVIERGKPMPECPLKFTETHEQYDEWVKYGRTERVVDPALRPQVPKQGILKPNL